ncbi:2,3-bisphosphoglycerate-dependent phosphoglycerate mutase [bacterium DOLZORAL124_38_8]|nr:MAG: 2,3-bisphosphoglycerate-dependent phosphoglycerate mutase [bacterium DOLZORAL124_38_8]
MAHLYLVRHGQSQWNLENRFTGWENPDLTEQGRAEARQAGAILKQKHIDEAFTSDLQRAQHTLDIILAETGFELPVTKNQALNERHYGDLQGLNKAETAEKFGKELVHQWRRSYDTPPPNGESLKDTKERVLPYFEAVILPVLKEGKDVLIVAHGNSLRALIMFFENLTPEEILKKELATGVPMAYEYSNDEYKVLEI